MNELIALARKTNDMQLAPTSRSFCKYTYR